LKNIFAMSMVMILAAPSSALIAQSQIRNGKMAVTSAKVRLQYKKYDEALEVLEEGKKIDPLHAPLYPLLGSLYVRNKEYAKADSAFTMAVSLDGKLEEDVKKIRLEEWSKLVNTGVKSMKAEDYDKSVQVLTNATVIYPEGVEAYINLGASYSNTGRDSLAIAPFQKALSLSTDATGMTIDIMVSLAKIHDKRGEAAKAREYYRKALASEPDNNDIKAALASSFLRSSSLDSARTIFTDLMSEADVDPNVAFNAALTEFQLENWQKSLDYLKKALDGFPDDMEILEKMSISMFQLEKYEEAIPYLEKMVKIDETSKEAWGSLVIAYAQIGENDKASRAHEKYTELGGE